jgi:hypothetical protein
VLCADRAQNILKFLVQFPLLIIACGGTAGCCTPERRRVVSREERRAGRALALRLGPDADHGAHSSR